MNEATHIGIVHNYNHTELVRKPVQMRVTGRLLFIFTSPLNPSNQVSAHQTWLVESENYWHIPGTSIKFDKLTGEQFVDNCGCGLMHYAFLQLNEVAEL